MPPALTPLIGVPTIELLHHKAGNVWQRGEQRNAHVALPGHALQNGGEPKGDPVASRGCEEITQREQEDVTLGEGLPNGVGADLAFCFSLFLQLTGDPIAFVLREPTRLPRPVREVENRYHSKYNGWNSLQYEQPSPAFQTKPGDTEQQSGER